MPDSSSQEVSEILTCFSIVLYSCRSLPVAQNYLLDVRLGLGGDREGLSSQAFEGASGTHCNTKAAVACCTLLPLSSSCWLFCRANASVHCIVSCQIAFDDWLDLNVLAGCNPLHMPLDLAKTLMNDHGVFKCANCIAGIQQCYACKVEGPSEGDRETLLFRCRRLSGGVCLRMEVFVSPAP